MKNQRYWFACLVLVSALFAQGWQTGPVSGFEYTRFDGEYFPGTGRVYFLGGRLADANTDGSIWSFDPATGIYADVGIDLPKPMSNYDICLLRDDYDLAAGDTFGLYVVGGRLGASPNNNTDTVQVYYPVTNRARVLPSDPYPGRISGLLPVAMASIVRDNRAYVMGGFNNTGAYVSNQTWVFDPLAPAGTRWTQLRNLPNARAYIIGATVDSFLYAIGGDTFDGTSLYARATCARFNTRDTAAGWAAIQSIPRISDQTRAYGFDNDSPYGFPGEIVVAGRGAWPEESAHCYRYTTGLNTWDTFPSLAQARRNHAGAFIPGEQGSGGVPGIWVWGGRQGADTNVLTITEYYQMPFTGTSESRALPVADAVSVSPNPSRGVVTVRSRAGRPASLRLYRVTGTQAYSAQSRTGCFTVTGLSPGAYLLRLETDHRIAESKLIVTK